MVDGGNALRDESLEINGAHYTELYNVDFRDFPDAAYTRDHFYDETRKQRNAWRMVPNRPIMKGEVYFANGYTTGMFAAIGVTAPSSVPAKPWKPVACGLKC